VYSGDDKAIYFAVSIMTRFALNLSTAAISFF